MRHSAAAMRWTQVSMLEKTLGMRAVPIGPVYNTLPKVVIIRGRTYARHGGLFASAVSLVQNAFIMHIFVKFTII
jgi:hypothetical protein